MDTGSDRIAHSAEDRASVDLRTPAVRPNRADGSGRWRIIDHALPISTGTIVLVLACGLALLAANIAIGYPPRPALVLFACLLSGIVVAIAPFVGLLGYAILAFMRPQDVFWGLGDERLTLIVSLTMLGATAIHFLRRPRLAFLAAPQNIVVVFLFLALYFSTQFGRFGSPEPRWLGYYAKIFIIYLVLLAVVDSYKKLAILAGVIALSLGYLGYWANERYFRDGWYIVNGPGFPGYTFYDHNDFAMVLAMSIPFLWFVGRAIRPALFGLPFIFLIPLSAHAVMVTFSRGGFLGMVTVMALMAFRERNRRLAAVMVVAGVCFYMAITGDAYRGRIMSIGSYEEDASAQARFQAWKAGKAMIADNLLFGVGLNQYLRAYQYYSSQGEHVAHNSWVQLAAECGIPAVASWALLLVLSFRSIWRIWRNLRFVDEERKRWPLALSNAFVGALLGYLVCGYFLSAEDLEFFYVLVAMVWTLERLTNEHVKELRAETSSAPVPPAALAAATPRAAVQA